MSSGSGRRPKSIQNRSAVTHKGPLAYIGRLLAPHHSSTIAIHVRFLARILDQIPMYDMRISSIRPPSYRCVLTILWPYFEFGTVRDTELVYLP